MRLFVNRCTKFRLYNNLLNELKLQNCNKRKHVSYSTKSNQASSGPKSRSFLIGMVGVGTGIVAGSTYSYFQLLEQRPIPNDSKETIPGLIHELPDVSLTRQVTSHNDTSNLDMILFQYPTCPFCCKVRTFLDYHGLSYKVVEVDPVLRQQLKWSTYKKVPILLVRVDGGFQQLNDSSAIVSILGSYLKDRATGIRELLKFYPLVEYHDENRSRKREIMNRYFLMFQNNKPDQNFEEIASERKWRKWADDVLVHSLSPNVYRTKDEAIAAFKWFSTAGEWEKIFPAWEVFVMVNVGALAMWIIGKRLKKRHGLKDDVRESFYDDCNTWLKELKQKNTPFHGGDSPDLADLAVYGVLSSIEGCDAFKDALEHTRIGDWYFSVKKLCNKNAGVVKSLVY